MTSYLRSIFGYGHSHQSSQSAPTSSSPGRSQSSGRTSRSHSRSGSAPTNYVYAAPPTASSTASHPSSKRSDSYSRATAPSPLRYATNDPSHHSSHSHRNKHSSSERPEMYRRASYKTNENVHRPTFAPSVSFSSDRTGSSTSLYPGSHHSGYSVPRSTSSSRVRYVEARPAMKQNHTWHGPGVPGGPTSEPHQYQSRHHSTLHMHPLLAATRLHSAPISYDILFTPSTRTVLDRTTHLAIPPHTLSQPATEPPRSSSIVLRSHKFPWTVLVKPSQGSSRFYIGSGKSTSSVITNLDILYALHSTLMTRITPQEWESLGHGSRAQRKVTRAYEKRCTRMGGGWEGGVRRVDWLGEKTRLVGVEVDRHAPNGGMGKLVFGKA